MAYETPITIRKAIEYIRKRHYVLPSIQREFVWEVEQIETLFDSLMRNYPIGTFLFWKVDKGKIKNFQFYEFLREYHQKDRRHNPKADLTDNEDIIALLDGQQRLTSLYLALVGSYAFKKPRMGYNNPKAYPKRKLYLNLLGRSEELEVEYDFRFLTVDELTTMGDDFYWFECSKVLSFKEKEEIYDYLEDNDLLDTSKFDKKVVRFSRSTLTRFYDVIHNDGTISFYLEEGDELDKVLQIFIRINSGGTKLSYSDLLLSIATAQWSERDAREVIHTFVDQINNVGDGFKFNKDLVLKNCLVLADFADVKFKVDNFNKTNMKTIEKNWEKTSSSLRSAIELVARFGYAEKSLTSTNAIIPIAYFIFKNNCDDEILDSSKWKNDRNAVKEWLARVLLKGTFGGQPDAIYPGMRDLINENSGRFPLKETIEYYKGKRKSISFSSDEIANLLDLQYGNPKTYCALTLIYPALNYSFRYHQDHIHPKSKFSKRAMKDAGISEDKFDQYNTHQNSIANLQLLEATSNAEKGDTPFKEWLNFLHPEKSARDRYLQQHHVDPAQSLEFVDFVDFVNARRKVVKGLLESILYATSEENDVDQ